MSDSEVQRLWQALNNLAGQVAGLTATINGQQALITEMRGDIKKMTIDGCAKATQHDDQGERIDDHEDRLRDVEKSRNMLAGMSSLVGATLGVVGSWLMKKIGG